MAKSKEDKDMLERGERIRAGLIISKYLRAVLQEKTELVSVAVGPDEVKQKLVSKGEKIARDMVRMAMDDELDPKMQLDYRKLVIERADGRAGTVQEVLEDDDKTIPEKISQANKNRLNRIAREIGEDNS